MDGSRILLAAHRGDRLKWPENTLPAFQSAIDFGVDMIETDVRMTGDGELVLIHDRSTLRTTGTDAFVDQLTLAELKQLDTGPTFSPSLQGIPIPTVREFLEQIKNSSILVNWELKVYPRDFGDEIAFAVADKLIRLIKAYHMEERSMLNSFSAKVLEYIRYSCDFPFPIHGQGIGNCRRSYDTAEIGDAELFDWCCLYPNECGGRALDDEENFRFCKDHNIHPCLCIPDTDDDYRQAISYGCKMFTSNDIYEAHRILTTLGHREEK